MKANLQFFCMLLAMFSYAHQAAAQLATVGFDIAGDLFFDNARISFFLTNSPDE
jgi:hypothetical protein